MEGRVCLRDSSNVYQQSLVASLIAENGEDEALRIVTGWADNPEILNNDVIILESIADGLCDIGIVNHYYLGRKLEQDPDFPVALVWAEQDGRGVHVNISGVASPSTRNSPIRPASSSNGSPPTGRTSWSTPTTSTRPTRPSRRSP